MKIFNFTNNATHNAEILIKNNWFEDIEDEQIPTFFKHNEDDEIPTPMIFLEKVDEFLYTDEDLFKEEKEEELTTPPQSPRQEQLLLTNYPHNQEEIIQYDISSWFHNTEEKEKKEKTYEDIIYIKTIETELNDEPNTIDFPEVNENFTRKYTNTYYNIQKTTDKQVYIIKLTKDTLVSEYDEIMRRKPLRRKLFYDEELNRHFIYIEKNKKESNKYYYPPLLRPEEYK